MDVTRLYDIRQLFMNVKKLLQTGRNYPHASLPFPTNRLADLSDHRSLQLKFHQT